MSHHKTLQKEDIDAIQMGVASAMFAALFCVTVFCSCIWYACTRHRYYQQQQQRQSQQPYVSDEAFPYSSLALQPQYSVGENGVKVNHKTTAVSPLTSPGRYHSILTTHSPMSLSATHLTLSPARAPLNASEIKDKIKIAQPPHQRLSLSPSNSMFMERPHSSASNVSQDEYHDYVPRLNAPADPNDVLERPPSYKKIVIDDNETKISISN